MTHKYERKCWSCGSKNMEKLTNYVKCKDCGATWNVVPKLKAAPITEVDISTDKAPGTHGPTRFKPRARRRRATPTQENSRS